LTAQTSWAASRNVRQLDGRGHPAVFTRFAKDRQIIGLLVCASVSASGKGRENTPLTGKYRGCPRNARRHRQSLRMIGSSE